MKRWHILFIVVAVLSVLLVACGGTASKAPLKVGTSADYPPYESKDQSNNFIGFDMDLVREIGKRSGHEIQIVDMSFDGLIAAVQEGKVDAVIAAMQATDARKEKVDFTKPYHFVSDAFIANPKNDVPMKTAKDAAGKKIGVQTGTVQEKWVMDNLVKPGLTKEDQVFRYDRADNAGLDLQAGRIDLVLVIADAGKKLADQMGLKVALVTKETVAAGQAIAIKKGNSALQAEFDKAIDDIQKDGTLDQLLKKYSLE